MDQLPLGLHPPSHPLVVNGYHIFTTPHNIPTSRAHMTPDTTAGTHTAAAGPSPEYLVTCLQLHQLTGAAPADRSYCSPIDAHQVRENLFASYSLEMKSFIKLWFSFS